MRDSRSVDSRACPMLFYESLRFVCVLKGLATRILRDDWVSRIGRERRETEIATRLANAPTENAHLDS